jgi:hypothetical protein
MSINYCVQKTHAFGTPPSLLERSNPKLRTSSELFVEITRFIWDANPSYDIYREFTKRHLQVSYKIHGPSRMIAVFGVGLGDAHHDQEVGPDRLGLAPSCDHQRVSLGVALTLALRSAGARSASLDAAKSISDLAAPR